MHNNQDPDVEAIIKNHFKSSKALRFHYWPNFSSRKRSRLGVFPYPLKNPFIPLIFAKTETQILALPSIWRGIRLARLGHIDALHIQYENEIHRRTRFDPDLPPEDLVDRTIQELEDLKIKGVGLAWSIHDAESHYDESYPHHIEKLRKFLANTVDMIHVFNHAGRAFAENMLASDPDKIELVELPTCFGAYGRTPKPTPAPIKRRFLCFGTILPMKGIEGFLDCVGSADVSDKCGVITVAGPFWPGKSPDLTQHIPANRDVEMKLGFVGDSDIVDLFSNADYVVVNYRRVLTSGVVALAMTMGKPIIGTNLGGTAEAVPIENHQLLYDPENPSGLRHVIEKACEMSEGEHLALQHACQAHAARRHPNIQSKKLEAALRKHGVL
ncbi:glycosyltransferase [Antarctobacter heliothermus]|nr:glycosyltransferase [Antarctobacter heliothermus]